MARTNLLELVQWHQTVRVVIALVAVVLRRSADLVPVRETLRACVLPGGEGAELSRVHISVRVDHHPPDAGGENLVPP